MSKVPPPRSYTAIVPDPFFSRPYANAAGILGRLALAVVEIGRHRDDRLGDLLAEIGLGGFLHLGQDEGADLARAVAFAARLDPGIAIVAADDLIWHEGFVLLDHRILEAAPDQPLDGKDRVLGVGDRLSLGRLSDQHLAGRGKRNDRRRGPRPFRVFDDLGLTAFHDGDAGICRPEIDPDHFGHVLSPAALPASRTGSFARRERSRCAGRVVYSAAVSDTFFSADDWAPLEAP
jgi:hypothetical protein